VKDGITRIVNHIWFLTKTQSCKEKPLHLCERYNLFWKKKKL